jgi:hypothetical protein
MGDFLMRSHPVLPYVRVSRRDWGRILAQVERIRDSLEAEGTINPNSPPEVIQAEVRKRYEQQYAISN